VYRRTNFPGDHPLWRGGLFPSPAAVGKALGESDSVLIVGANVFTWFLHTEGAPFRRELSVVQVDDDPWEIGRSYPVSLGIVADPRETLVELTKALATTLTDAARTAARARAETIGRGRAGGGGGSGGRGRGRGRRRSAGGGRGATRAGGARRRRGRSARRPAGPSRRRRRRRAAGATPARA